MPIELKLMLFVVIGFAFIPVMGLAVMHPLAWILMPLGAFAGFCYANWELKNANRDSSER